MRILSSLSICALACGGPGKSAVRDNNKIHDEAKHHPAEAEVADRIEDEDDRYDADNDEDGDGDRDGDRILDQHDLCPNEAETYNAMEDEDGCPDIRPVRATHDPHKYSIIIYFRDGSSELSKVEAQNLDTMADLVKADPRINLLAVTGHSALDEENSDRLAWARADAVAEALVQRGIDPERVQALGAGSKALLGVDSERRRRVCFHFLVWSGKTVGRWDGTDVLRVVP